ncbi:hypothetical protein P148_SR1C00001G0274 [candidate division SR1 bacterium RAAC1_SR1_1]|nr:hypothetical protein P148_SR1C00001G0274 [candidate division SR1 bacterium RAAC1_SR1_1]
MNNNMENQENKIKQGIYDSLLEKKEGVIRGKRINYVMVGVVILVAIDAVLLSLSLLFLGILCLILISFIIFFINRVPLGKISEPTQEEIKLGAKNVLEVRVKELQERKRLISECEAEIEALKKLIN